MENNIEKIEKGIELVEKGMTNLIENIIDIRKQQKAMQYQLNNIQIAISSLNQKIEKNKIEDHLNVLVNKIDGLNSNINDTFETNELTGKKIYELKNKMGMSWNKMTAQYNVPKSTLQYRCRQYKKKLFRDQVEEEQ